MTEPQLCNCACHNGVALVHFAPCCSLCQRCGAMVPHGVAHACRVQMTKESIKVIFVALEVDGMPSLGSSSWRTMACEPAGFRKTVGKRIGVSSIGRAVRRVRANLRQGCSLSGCHIRVHRMLRKRR
jgi:hypothetical protein